MKLKALAAALLASACMRAHHAPMEAWAPVAVTAAPAALGASDVGSLHFIGGLELHGASPNFGGLSDLHVDADGRLLAMSDAGHFLRGRLTFDAAGAPTGLIDAEIAPERDEAGAVLASKEAGDSEGMAVLADGRVAISFEQNQVIRLYDLRGAEDRAPVAGPPLAGIETLDPNGGLEALAPFGDGRLLVGAEYGGADGSMLWIAPLDARAPVAPIARLHTPTGFGLADLDRLPSGDFVAIERFYSPVIGVRIRLVKLNGAALAQGRVEETLLAEMGAPLALDNFEGVSAVALPNGRVRLYLINDDNFSPRQRTLLYAFELTAP